MKKKMLLVALAILAVSALPVMAGTTYAWSGEVTSQFQTDLTSASEAVATANLSVGVTINDVLTATGVIFTSNTSNWALTDGNGVFDGSVNLGKVFGLDPKSIGEVVTVGYFAPGATTYGVSGIGNEGQFGAGAAWSTATTPIQLQSVTTIDNMVNVQLAVDPGSLESASPQYLADLYGTVGPISVSLGYGSNKLQGADVQFAQAMGDLGFAVDAQEQYDTSGTGIAKIGLGGRVTYKTLLTFGIGTNYSTATTGGGIGPLGINVNFVPAATWGADLGVQTALDGSWFTNLGYVDASVWTKLDASTLRVGYDYTQNTGGYELARLKDGGVYFSYDISF